MKEYQPWGDDWRKELTFVPSLPSQREDMDHTPILPMYPIFVSALEKLEGEAFWQAVGGAILYLIGHEPDNPLVKSYVEWINQYNPNLAIKLMLDGTTAASQFDLETAIWMLQASLLMDPELVEANYNLGLAFSHLGDALQKEERQAEADSSYKQAYQYLNNALQLDPELSMAYYTLGVVCRRIGKQDESKFYLEKAINLDIQKKENEEMSSWQA
jgi:tetratricopeptide (TPR) repeat protein